MSFCSRPPEVVSPNCNFIAFDQPDLIPFSLLKSELKANHNILFSAYENEIWRSLMKIKNMERAMISISKANSVQHSQPLDRL